MDAVTAVTVLAAGTVAGTVNTIVGAGSLVTFPVLLGAGLSPVTANMSNTVGLVPGSVSGALGYRTELAGQGRRLRTLGAAALAGGLSGGVLLRVAPGAFSAVVPALVLLGSVLMGLQPRITRQLAARRAAVTLDATATGAAAARESRRRRAVRLGLVFATSVYGGYFGAAQGVLLLTFLALTLDEDLQRLNAAKNVLAGLVNAVAAVLFIATAHIDWAAAGLLAAGSTVGGQLGARYGRRIPTQVLRTVIVVGGVIVATVLAIQRLT